MRLELKSLCMGLLASSLTFATTVTCAATPTEAAVPVNTPSLSLLQGSTNPIANPSANPTPNAKPMLAAPVITVPPPPALDVKGYVLMDGTTGKILASYNPDTQLAPASLTKMMTSYVISMAIKDGKIKMDDLVPISEKAWRMGGSKMFVKVGTQVPVKDLMQGIIVDSGNDACVAMAEYVAGSEDAFANLMNQTAAALGMKNTHYVDSTGLPDPNHHSTPHDLAILARALIYSFPEDYQWYSQKWFTYNGIRQPNRNRLLWRDPTVDGIKTGHTDEAGYCLTSSAVRNGTRLISVVMGAPTDAARADYSQRLLDYGFRFFETHAIYQANTALTKVRVWNGAEKEVNAGVLSPFIVSVIPGQYPQLKLHLTMNGSVHAPVTKGQKLGEVTASINGKDIEKADVVALQDDEVGGFWRRMLDKVEHWFHKG